MRPSALIACALLAGAALPAAAQIKPGLWEMHQKMGGNPGMDQAMAEMQKQMESMPPDQRKQMEAMMAARGMQMGGAGGGMAMKLCVTREMADRSELPVGQGDCKVTRRQRSGNTMTATAACTNPPSTADTQVTFHSPESYSSKTTITSRQHGRPETTTVEGTGKWLGADCGSVKPVPQR